jgi:hypothetical protein
MARIQKKKQKKNKEKTKEQKKQKKKKKTTQCFTVDLHSKTLSNFSLFSINKLN